MVTYKWIILFSAWVAFFASSLVRFVVPSILPTLREAFQLTGREAGLLAAMFWVGYALFQLPSGFVSDRQGPKRALLVGTALTAVLELAAGWSRDYSQLLMMQFLVGCTSAFIWPPGMLLMLNWFEPNERATAAGFFNTAFSAGAAMSFFASTSIAENFGWNSPFLVYAGALGVSAIIVGLLVAEKKNAKLPATLPKTIVLRTLTNKEVWFDSLARFGSAFAYLGAASWMTSYFVKSLDVPLVQAGVFGAWIILVGAFGSPLGGMISDRIFKRRALTILMGIAGVGIVMLILGSGTVKSLSMALILFALAGLSLSISVGPSSSIISEFKLESSAWGFAVSFVNFMTQLAGAMAPAIFGLVLDISGSYNAGWMLLGLVALIFSIGPILLVREGY